MEIHEVPLRRLHQRLRKVESPPEEIVLTRSPAESEYWLLDTAYYRLTW